MGACHRLFLPTDTTGSEISLFSLSNLKNRYQIYTRFVILFHLLNLIEIKKAVYDRLIKILHKHNCTFLLLEPALEKGRGCLIAVSISILRLLLQLKPFSSGYYHPVNGEPITSISLELSLPKKRQIKSGTFVDPQEDCIELFVLFSYEKERRLELQNTIDITHRQAICPVVRNDLPCGFQGFLRNSYRSGSSSVF